MKAVGDVFKTASGVFGLVPGIAIIATNLGVPPGASKYLFAGVIESLGILTLLVLWANRERIMGFTPSRITRLVIVSAVLFLFTFFGYLYLFGTYVIEVPNSNPLLFPMKAQGELAKGMTVYGNELELIHNWGRDDVFKVIQSSSSGSLLWTELIFLLNYLVLFVSLTFAFGILGVRNRVKTD